jgi:hypothetical protein
MNRENTIYTVGCILGLASKIDRNVLTEICLHPTEGFLYTDQCWQVARLLEDIDHESPNDISE